MTHPTIPHGTKEQDMSEEPKPSEMGTDATAWAREFCKRWPSALCQIPGHEGIQDGDDFEATVLGWFANAIETAKDAAWNQRAKPVVKALVFDKYGEAKAGGAKYCIYEAGSQGLWNCVCYPHEDVQYRIAEGVSRDEAVKLANEDQTRRVHACLEGYDD